MLHTGSRSEERAPSVLRNRPLRMPECNSLLTTPVACSPMIPLKGWRATARRWLIQSLDSTEFQMPVIPEIAAMHEEMTAWRRDLHAHPELGFVETRTARVIAEKLEEMG